MGGVDRKRPQQAATRSRAPAIERRREALEYNEQAIIEQGDSLPVVGHLAAVVKQRRAQQQRVGVATAQQRVADIQAMALVEARHTLEQQQLARVKQVDD